MRSFVKYEEVLLEIEMLRNESDTCIVLSS